MHLTGKPVASFDPEGLIFSVGLESKMVKLYDLRSFDKVCDASMSQGGLRLMSCSITNQMITCQFIVIDNIYPYGLEAYHVSAYISTERQWSYPSFTPEKSVLFSVVQE